MTKERWNEVRTKIKETFKVLEEYQDDLEPGTADTLEFEGPGAQILRAAFCVQPKVIDKKTLYSHRAGGDVRVDYTYSDTDEVSYLTLDRWNEGIQEWQPIDGTRLF